MSQSLQEQSISLVIQNVYGVSNKKQNKERKQFNQSNIKNNNNKNNNIEQQQHKNKQNNIKNFIKDTQLHICTQSYKLNIYFTVNKIYLQNLLNRRQKPAIKPQVKAKIGANYIIYKQIYINQKNTKDFLGNQPNQLNQSNNNYNDQQNIINQIHGNLRIAHNSQINLQIKLSFKQNLYNSSYDNVWFILRYYNLGIWKTKSLQYQFSNNTFTWKIPINDINQYIQENFLFNITLKKPQRSNDKFLGIKNLGNTCYMNSCLQMMYFIRPLRKIILESKSKNKLFNQVKQAFIGLMDLEQKRAIDIQNLLQAYDKFNQIPRRQQDVQEFLLDFINQLESQQSGLKNLWQGQCLETTFSMQPSKDYISTVKQSFAQLDVHMFDHDRTYYRTIEDSLLELIKQQQVDQMIQNDKYGKIKVKKVKRYENLPDVLFINLKRYQYNKERMRTVKIGSHIEYQENLNLSFLAQTDTPGRIGHHNPEYDYTLFSVIVHKGTSPQNGHYFSFINTSNNPQYPEWFQFNDSVVRKSDSEQVLKFTGKKIKDIILDRNQGRFTQIQVDSDQSSYLLVYIRKNVFRQFQSIKTVIPKAYLKQKIKRKAQADKKNLQQFNVFVFPSQSDINNFDIFSEQLQFNSIPLNLDLNVIQQLSKIDNSFLGCKLFKVYKVNRSQKKIKIIDQQQILKNIANVKRGHMILDYILIIPSHYQGLNSINSQKMQIQQPQSDKTIKIYQQEYYTIIHITRNEFEDQLNLPKYLHISIEQLDNFQSLIQQKGGLTVYVGNNDKEDFIYGWTNYLEVQIMK